MSDQPGEESAAESPADYGCRLDMAFDAAREFIRLQFREDGCITSVGEVLEHLDDRFGKAAGITTDVSTVLDLCAALWEDPHIDQVPSGWIDFCWREKGNWPRETQGPQDLRARLLRLNDQEERP
jgi:hypothetical protein